MLEELKQIVFEGNMALQKSGLVILTWGNVSAYDPDSGLVVIKPSGVPYEKMGPEDMVVLDLEGNIVDGSLRPSSDTPTHLELYRDFPQLRAVVHTHSTCATSWAQSGRPIPAYGTTHADYFYGEIPCTRPLTREEIETDYEYHTGTVIVETLNEKKLDPLSVPAVIIANHGPFTWGESVAKAVENAVVLEEVARMALISELINPRIQPAPVALQDKHYFRKHGAGAYYGQK